MPFSKAVKLEADFPYAYTLGIYVGKKFKTRTYVFNFERYSTEDVFELIRASITYDIRTLLDNKKFAVNAETVKFIGWAPLLEKKLLARLFPDAIVKAFNDGFELSLSRLTPEFEGKYFGVLKSQVAQNLDPDFVAIRHLEHDGALAALAGYLLASQISGKGKYYFPFEVKTLLKEIKEYSKEDVTRMAFLNDNPVLFKERKEKALELMREKQKVIKHMQANEKLVNRLSDLEQEKTVEMIIKDLKEENTDLQSKKEKMEKEFDNM